MNKKHFINRKKILISDDHTARYVDAALLADLCEVSEKHAYRIMSNPDGMTPTIERLLKMQLLGTVHGWPAGWRFQDGKLWSPSGRGCEPHDIEQTLLIRDIQRDYENKVKALENELDELREQFKKPRLAVDNPPPQRRVLRVVK